MKLNEALKIIASASERPAGPTLWLVCGFEPLHLKTFLQATYLTRASRDRLHVETGLYGDIEGNLARARDAQAPQCALVLEWSDLDPRLGLRSRGPWSGRQDDIVRGVRERLQRLSEGIRDASARARIAVCPPTLSLAFAGHTPPFQRSAFELALEQSLATFLADVAQCDGVRVVDAAWLSERSPAGARHDPRMELGAGFPYRLGHASELASCLLALLSPPTPKKGLITDLDDTLWRGLVGEVGAEAVTWTQEHGAQLHGLYQSMLQQLHEAGALLAVASKNESAVVAAALSREDLFVSRDALFPIHACWDPKSQAVSEILARWNVGADDVVLVDDNPMELAEVARAHPGITCRLFPKRDPEKLLSLLTELRSLFGTAQVTDDDRLRASSLRATQGFTRARDAETDLSSFLAGLDGQVTFARGEAADLSRALQLLNKTNQFNLNGERISEAALRALAVARDGFLLTASYCDRYGPLGNIGVAAGTIEASRLVVSHWVLSCRAFSRHLEHHMLSELLRVLPDKPVALKYRPTARNGPLQSFLASLAIDREADPVQLDARVVERLAHFLPHAVSHREP